MDFNEQIELLSNEKLISIIKSKADYQEKFLNCAVLHAEKRGLGLEIKDIVVELEKKKTAEEKELKENTAKEFNAIELYSDRTIIGFSVLFSSIAGAILLSNNLKKLKKEGGVNVILFGVLYTIGIIIIITLIPDLSLRPFCLILNILGGYIITFHFKNKLYPKDLEYKNKKSWKVFIIAFLLFLGVGFIYALSII